MPTKSGIALHWFRRDLRISDNTSLTAALESAEQVIPLYIPSDWTGSHPWTGPGRQQFLCECLESLAKNLESIGGRLIIRRGHPLDVIPRLLEEYEIQSIHTAADPDPHGKSIETKLGHICQEKSITLSLHLDVPLHRFEQTTKDDGTAYRVYTPYSKRWLALDKPEPLSKPKSITVPEGLASEPLPSLETWQLSLPSRWQALPGGEKQARKRLDKAIDHRLQNYSEKRDFPAAPATSRLSQDLRWGTLSIRTIYQKTKKAHDAASSETERKSFLKFIKELAWRDFYLHLLEAFPEVLREEFNKDYLHLPWDEPGEQLEAWKCGQTGFPLVDAGMRELATTGFMHNRVRMIVAMFLTKDLHLDWRLGEQHFAQLLLDGEIASNNGGWQWSAGTGADAAPYFRIQNPWTQSKRFDSDGEYIRKWVPELEGIPSKKLHQAPESDSLTKGYPAPICDHAKERDRTLKIFEKHRARVKGNN